MLSILLLFLFFESELNLNYNINQLRITAYFNYYLKVTFFDSILESDLNINYI